MYLFLFALLAGIIAAAPSDEASLPAVKFDLNDPSQRQLFAETLAQKRQVGIERARQFLLDTGRPKRWTDGRAVYELMSIENGQPIIFMTLCINSAISIAADVVRDNPYYQMRGDSLIAGVWDEGIARISHQELAGRIVSKDGSSLSNHSTLVSGVLAASGINPNAAGMAPLAVIYGYDWDSDASETAIAAMSSAGQADKIQISNHSYGNICGWHKDNGTWSWYGNPSYRESDLFGQYNYLAEEFDQVCWNAPYYLPFRAAGNDRYDTARPAEGQTYLINGTTSAVFTAASGPYADTWDNGGFDTLLSGACAKNVMTVGSVNDAVSAGSRDLSKAAVSTFSAWGPTDDGRIKPDIVANGYTVYSSSSAGDSTYETASGTSLAAPAAAGAACQLLDLYRRLFPGQYMTAAALKALMIHTADDLGKPGPDYMFGWGLLNNARAAEKLLLHKRNPSAANIIEDQIYQTGNTTDTFAFEWDGISPIKATLCWTDPPGSKTKTGTLDDSTPKLVNNLGIVIIAPDGLTCYYPFVLDPANPNAAASSGINNRDNVKQVFIEAPLQAGQYTVQISADSIRRGFSPQAYCLIISGQQQPALADLDGDGQIGLTDVLMLAQEWMADSPASDIYPALGDGRADLLDFNLLALQWLSKNQPARLISD